MENLVAERENGSCVLTDAILDEPPCSSLISAQIVLKDCGE